MELIPDELKENILATITALGPGDDLSNGKRRIDEKTYPEITDFKVSIYPKESQHRGRPHCTVETDKGNVSVDLKTFEIISGNAGRWNTPVIKAVKQHQEELLKLWKDTRPDDQRLPTPLEPPANK